jgi:regulator of replication initiation timing
MRTIEVERLTRSLKDTMRQRDEAVDEIERLRAENERLREALKCLVDEQNGPPLLQREHYWREAMDMAGAALNLSRHK